MLLQSMTVRLGIATGMDLANDTSFLNKPVAIMFWIIAELAIIATDIAEVIGSAIALDLIFGIPLIVGALITVFDVFLLLFIMKFGFRKIRSYRGNINLYRIGHFVFEVYISSPHIIDMLNVLCLIKKLLQTKGILYIALGIIGALLLCT